MPVAAATHSFKVSTDAKAPAIAGAPLAASRATSCDSVCTLTPNLIRALAGELGPDWGVLERK